MLCFQFLSYKLSKIAQLILIIVLVLIAYVYYKVISFIVKEMLNHNICAVSILEHLSYP